jgi:8-oxo-dGTP diphosphatase
MLAEVAGNFWKILPVKARRGIIRWTQANFTASTAAVIVGEERRILLLNHFIRPNSGWGLPGGFLQKGEQPEAAIRREVREETGLEIESLRVIGARTIGTNLEILFAGRSSGTAAVRSSEVRDLAWFAAPELPSGLSHAHMAAIVKVLGGEV